MLLDRCRQIFELTNIVLSFLSVLIVVAKQPYVAQGGRGAAPLR